MSTGAISILSGKLSNQGAVADRPERKSFEEFLEKDARVPIGGGLYGPYSFKGREVIRLIVRVIDQILTQKLTDSSAAIAGGAQWGKTVLELNLAAYATGQRFFNFGMFLPDMNLVAGVIDTKFRPDVVDQVPWFAGMVRVGKAINNSGKAVDRKGAFMVTDGKRRSNGIVLGLQKVPTTFTLDIAALDEVDDIPERNAKYVRGRLTSSALRFILKIGTQRVHSRGQNKAWKDGSQGVVHLGGINPEESFPSIVRIALSGTPSPSDPKLTWSGDFRHDTALNDVVAIHRPGNVYYLADPSTGRMLDRFTPELHHRQPERIEDRNWSFRVSQLSIGAIGLSQIVSQFQLAVEDVEEMVVFRCDVLALPQSTTQALNPRVIERAQSIEPFEMRMRSEPGRGVFAGVDAGDKCYFWARERESAIRKRLMYATTMPAGDLVKRSEALFYQLGVSCLAIDQRPLVSQSRALALSLNGLNALERFPEVPAVTNRDAHMSLPGGLVWDGRKQMWRGAKCFVVRFDKNSLGAGIEHGFDVFEEGGMTKFVPLIRCNRYETIDRAVKEFLTPDENVVETVDRQVRLLPSMLLPIRAGSKVVEMVESHLITGSEREKEKDGSMGEYAKQCANHFLLADAYSALAEGEGFVARPQKFAFEPIQPRSNGFGNDFAPRIERTEGVLL